jgi:hypothetical protein
MTKRTGSGSESISQRHGSADRDVMDPEHWLKIVVPDSSLLRLH